MVFRHPSVIRMLVRGGALFFLLIGVTSGSTLSPQQLEKEETQQPCNVCGDEVYQVGDPGMDVTFFHNQQTITMKCNELETIGAEGTTFSAKECLDLPNQISVTCGCQDAATGVSANSCNVCGEEGFHVSDPDRSVSVKFEQSTSLISTTTSTTTMKCRGDIETIGAEGTIFSKEQCLDLPNQISVTCGCRDAATGVSANSCNVCGEEGFYVGDPDRSVSVKFEESPTITSTTTMKCGDLERIGAEGTIFSKEQCLDLPHQILVTCDCRRADGIAATATNPCNVCGTGKQVGNLDAVVNLTGVSAALGRGIATIQCGQLQTAGECGWMLTSEECTNVPNQIAEVCDCTPTSSAIEVDVVDDNAPSSAPTGDSSEAVGVRSSVLTAISAMMVAVAIQLD